MHPSGWPRPILAMTLLLGFGCGDDEAPPPLGPATIQLLNLQHAGGPRWHAGDAELTLGCDASAPLIVEVGPNPGGGDPASDCARSQAACPRPGSILNWTLRTPGSCGEARQCGDVVVFVDGVRVGEAASTSLLVPVPSANAEHTIRVELQRGDGTPALDRDRQVLADEYVVPFVAPADCSNPDAGAPDDAGSDAPADAAGE
jgi:hypothetical protein